MSHLTDSTLGSIPSAARPKIAEALAEGPVIPANIVATVVADLGIEIGHLMIMLLPTAAAYARVPISGFHVGAVALGMPPGSLYLGSNMEFTDQALSFGVHGEQSATNNAWLNGETGLQALAVNAAPCGYCRQFLYEITTATTDFNLILKQNPKNPDDYGYTLNPLTYYLPDAFGPQDLGLTGGLMEPEDHGLNVAGTDPTVEAALAAANASYSPYTKDYSGVAIQTSSGLVTTGRYAENAAYNPSMSPLESALAIMSMNEPPQTAYNITAAVLVEAAGSKAGQLNATQDVVSSVASGVTVQHVVTS